MAKQVIQTKRGAPLGGAYPQGWRAGDFVFVTGTGPIDPVTGGLVGDCIEDGAGPAASFKQGKNTLFDLPWVVAVEEGDV